MQRARQEEGIAYKILQQEYKVMDILSQATPQR